MTVELNAVFSTECNLEDIFFFQEVLILEESEFLLSAIS